jgi:DNA-binding response OmpR family regulator
MSRILVIDDDIRIRETLLDVLTYEGHKVITCNSGDAAHSVMWERRGSEGIEVVICDWNLGPFDKRNGSEIVEFLHREWPAVRYIIFSGLDRDAPEGVEFFDKGRLPELLDAL